MNKNNATKKESKVESTQNMPMPHSNKKLPTGLEFASPKRKKLEDKMDRVVLEDKIGG